MKTNLHIDYISIKIKLNFDYKKIADQFCVFLGLPRPIFAKNRWKWQMKIFKIDQIWIFMV